jgi:hypothetical protein
MASYSDEKALRAHIELLDESADYKAYFVQGDSGAWVLGNSSDKAAADALLNAKISASDFDIGAEEPNGSGPSDFDGYDAVHFDDDIADAGVSYRAWFVKEGTFYKADNGDSSSLAEITDEAEIATLIEDSGYISE